ncbi:hypothetical protein Pcinc_020659 [Petrolisthes cinctipes]|uniref:Uncharacterized protein n=1 Tax=Petrolisthes cinctipes TaxID=88211 RepID=A0AAE1FHW8_PETCI|nr:hypothetical protein Pcinc_020659 [Petrolisthes cinctipes]
MTPVDNVMRNFLSFAADGDQFLHRASTIASLRDRERDMLALGNDLFKTLNKMLPSTAAAVSAAAAATPPPETSRYSVRNGYTLGNGKAMAPFTISVRNRPIFFEDDNVNDTYLFNQLLFPVYSVDSPEDVLFFARLRKSTLATLFLPGLFRFGEQYISGVCEELQRHHYNTTVQWRYTLSDYSPICPLVSSKKRAKQRAFFESLKSGNSKMPVLLPLSF